MSRDYRLRVTSPYFLYLYVKKYKSVAFVGPSVAVGPCALHILHTLLLRHCVSGFSSSTLRTRFWCTRSWKSPKLCSQQGSGQGC